MSRDAVTIASLTAERDAAQRHVRRLLHVLRAVGHEDGPERCFCSAWAEDFGECHLAPDGTRCEHDAPGARMAGDHTEECQRARRELLALRQEERA